MDTAPINRLRHKTVKSVYLPNQVTLAHTANRRVAGHLPNGGGAMGYQGCFRTHARSGSGGLAPSVPSTNDDDFPVRAFHVKHLLSNTERRENIVENIIGSNPAG